MAGLTSNRDLNDLIEESISEGFIIEKCGSGHLKWTPPGYPEAAFVTSSTPATPRIVEHAKLQKRRALAGYSSRLSSAKKRAALDRLDKMNKKKKEPAMTTDLKDKPFRKLLRNVKTMPPEFATPKLEKHTSKKFERETIGMYEGARKAKELQLESGKPIEECAEIIASTFRCTTPFKSVVGAKALLNLVNKKKRGPAKKILAEVGPIAVAFAEVTEELKAAVEAIPLPQIPKLLEPVMITVPEPVAAVLPEPKLVKLPAPVILSAQEQILEHIRSVIGLPIPKQQRMDIVIDILDKSLS